MDFFKNIGSSLLSGLSSLNPFSKKENNIISTPQSIGGQLGGSQLTLGNQSQLIPTGKSQLTVNNQLNTAQQPVQNQPQNFINPNTNYNLGGPQLPTQPVVRSLIQTPTQQQLPGGGVSQAPSGFNQGGNVSGQLSQGGGISISPGSFAGLGSNLQGGGLIPQPETDEEYQARVKAEQKAKEIAPFEVPAVNVPIDTGAIVAAQDRKLNQVVSSTDELSNASYQETLKIIENKALEIKRQLDTMSPTPATPVIETPEQNNFVNQSNNPIGLRAQMDNLRVSLGLPALEVNKIDLMKQKQATIDVFNGIIKDIQSNPNLPASLAQRRITQFTKDYQQTINMLDGQLGILNEQIKQANDSLDREMGIVKLEQAEEEKSQNNAQSQLSLLISSKGLVGTSDEELKRLATAAGFEVTALKSIQDRLSSEKDVTNINFETDANGNVRAIGIKDGKPIILGNLGVIGKPQGDSYDTILKDSLDNAIANKQIEIKEENKGELFNWIKNFFTGTKEAGNIVANSELDNAFNSELNKLKSL